MDALIVDAVRSPIGRRNGTLAALRGDDLAAQVLNALAARNDLDPAEVEDVQMGCVTQVGEQGWNVGRMAVLAAGWPVEVSATTVDRQCGSSMQTNFNAAAADRRGSARRRRLRRRRDDVARPDGLERRLDLGAGHGPARDRDAGDICRAARGGMASSRDSLDAYSLESHRRAIAASDDGRFEREIVPIELPDGQGSFAVDEAPRRETSAEALAALKPAFRPDGVVTAGNSSQIVDGSAAVLVASERAAERLDLTPRARFLGFGIAGVDPTRMLHGNPQAMEKALARAGLTLDDMSVIEINEAFASVVLQTVGRPAPRRAHGRRQSERRGHLARSSARGDRRADHGDARLGARAPRRALRDRVDVRRVRHGDRRGGGAAVKIGVVGLGAMGSGIAQLAIEAGFETVGHELELARAEAARDRIAHFLTRKVEKGTLGQGERDAAVARLSLTADLADLAGCDVVIEAAFEDLAVKQELYPRARGGRARRRDPRDEHLGALGDGDRVGARAARADGRHALLQPGAADAARRDRARRAHVREAWDAAFELGAKLGKTPIRCSDTPGFVVNRILIPLLNDCVRVLDEAGVTPETLDEGMTKGAGWPMGPCTLLDLVGADVHVHASEALYEKLREPRMAPPARLVRMLQAGKLGRKTGEGFYTYESRPSAALPTVGRQMAMCQVCRRTLLAGERYRTWRWARRDQTVCVVCEPEAREAGAVRVVDAFECVRVSGLTQNVRRVA